MLGVGATATAFMTPENVKFGAAPCLQGAAAGSEYQMKEGGADVQGQGCLSVKLSPACLSRQAIVLHFHDSYTQIRSAD